MLRSLKRSLAVYAKHRIEMENAVSAVKEEFDIEVYGITTNGNDTKFEYEIYTDEDIDDSCADRVAEFLRGRVA